MKADTKNKIINYLNENFDPLSCGWPEYDKAIAYASKNMFWNDNFGEIVDLILMWMGLSL